MKKVSLPLPHTTGPSSGALDALFVLLVALYALAVAQGIVPLSGQGADLDSDLSVYAYSMIRADNPQDFQNDAILREATPANSLWNLQQFIAELLTPGDQYAVGLLRAGALIIFVYLTGMYALGRWLYAEPGPALILALLMSITIWVGWGTFWGVTHSDPVPRTFFAALWPFMLMGAVAALRQAAWRPAVMFITGLGMWVHSLGALNTGAMFFLAFAFHRPQGWSWSRHILNLALCLVVYFTPVLLFLWPSLVQKQGFGPAELETFHALFSLRWAKDYGHFAERLTLFLSPGKPVFWILLAGLGSWFVVIKHGSERLRRLASMYPAFVLALALVATFSWLESFLAPRMGRLPMAHEFVRGLRYLLPLAWIMIGGVVAVFWLRFAGWLRTGFCVLAVLLVMLCNGDKQNVAALYAITSHTGLPLPHMDKARADAVRAQSHHEALEALERLTAPGDVIYSNAGDMGVRHIAKRGMGHTFKDGAHSFYNKNLDQARQWLANEKLRTQSPTGYVDVWLKSGLPWLISDRPEDRDTLEKYGQVVWENPGWLIVRRKAAAAAPSTDASASPSALSSLSVDASEAPSSAPADGAAPSAAAPAFLSAPAAAPPSEPESASP
ncbi:translation initiation factor 2 [Desulfovibrio sp. MES5]|uniref:translation initiation factor 2 n=1 Tax=Desulfovibrio sp. MES5 TaxID=1899016 RepID=UPI0025BD1015|nr:translation initiation factor 2 [Desulfovibrio sp. MES5]